MEWVDAQPHMLRQGSHPPPRRSSQPAFFLSQQAPDGLQTPQGCTGILETLCGVIGSKFSFGSFEAEGVFLCVALWRVGGPPPPHQVFLCSPAPTPEGQVNEKILASTSDNNRPIEKMGDNCQKFCYFFFWFWVFSLQILAEKPSTRFRVRAGSRLIAGRTQPAPLFQPASWTPLGNPRNSLLLDSIVSLLIFFAVYFFCSSVSDLSVIKNVRQNNSFVLQFYLEKSFNFRAAFLPFRSTRSVQLLFFYFVC